MATNLNYNVNVNATNGIQALNNLQNKVQGVNDAFGGLKNALAGIAIGSIIGNLLRFADNIQDLSDATGIATANILGFQKAVQAFGGSAEGADKAILRLVQNVGEAAEGSAGLQLAFSKVGVSLNDLATLSEQDILAKVLRGLESIPDKATRSALATQLLGKEFRNVSLSGFNEYLNQSTEASRKNAEAIARAAELQGNLEKALGKVKMVLLEILSPVADFINSLDQTRVLDFVENITKLAAALVALSALGRVTAAMQALQVAFSGVLSVLLGLIVNVLKFGTIVGRVLTALGAAAVALATLFPETAAKISAAIGEATDSVKEFFGFKVEDNTQQLDKNTDATKRNTEATKEGGKVVREVVDPFKQLRQALSGMAEEYGRVNQLNIEQIKNQTALIGKSREEQEVVKARTDLMKRESDEIRKLEEQRAKLTEAQVNAGLGKVIDEQIQKIREQTKADMEATESAIRNSQERVRAYDLEKFARQSQIDVEKQIRDIQFEIATSTMSEMEKKAAQIKRDAYERAEAEIKAQEAARGTLLTEQEKAKYYEAAKQKTEDLVRANQELYDKSRQFSTGWKKAYQEYVDNATNAAKRAESIFRKATQGMEDLIVNFAKTGKFEWKNFVAMMLEELLRAQIQQIFAQLLGGMKDSMSPGGGGIMGAIGGLFGGGGGGGQEDSGGFLDSILGGISSIFGGGGGGSGTGKSMNDPLYVYDVSGGGGGMGGMGGIFGQGQGQGQGGGIWETIKSTAGSVWEGVKDFGSSVFETVSNIGSGVWDAVSGIGSSIGSAFGGVTDAIGGLFGGGDSGGSSFVDDIVGGIGDFFGGFFANGGSLPKGKFGVVGENGPEFVSGPANITPMGGGTAVTYNINAVDAMSFKQMLAQDPSFIYALSLQGQGGVPSRR